MDQDVKERTTRRRFKNDMNNDLLSIIIPCYNDYLYVATAVNSALQQTWRNKEIIIVDDGSSAQTKKVLNGFLSNNIKLITQNNQGTSAARNNGIIKSNGKYILVLDADDYFEPEFAEKAIEVLISGSNIKMVTCFGRWFESDKKSVVHKPAGGGIDKFMYQSAAFGSTLFKKKDWERIGGYDEKMKLGFEDWEFYIRLLKAGGVSYVLPEILFHYRKTENSRNSLANTKKYEIWEYIFLKHADLYIQDYERMIGKFMSRLQQLENEKDRLRKKPDFRLGYYLLFPLRKIKQTLQL